MPGKLLLVCLVLYIPSCVAYQIGSFLWMKQVILQDPDYAREAALEMAQLCRSEKALWWNNLYHSGPTPPDYKAWSDQFNKLRRTPPAHGYIRPHEAYFTVATGHDHFGYIVILDQSSSRSVEMKWDCHFWQEDSSKWMCSVTLPANSGLSDEEFLQRARQRVATNPDKETSNALEHHMEMLFHTSAHRYPKSN